MASNIHEQNSRSASHGLPTKPSCSTSKYDTSAFAASAIKSRSLFQKNFLTKIYVSYPTLSRITFFNSYNQKCGSKLVAPLFQTDF